MPSGIADQHIFETPISVLDFETTGLSPGADRVIEVSVMRMDPGAKPQFVLDTLVNPRRSVAATEIHGITDADVADAPTFEEIAPKLIDVLSGSVLAASSSSSSPSSAGSKKTAGSFTLGGSISSLPRR